MASLDDSLDAGMRVDGVIGVALAEWSSGMTLGTRGGGERLDIELAAALNCNVVKAKLKALQALGNPDALTDILIGIEDQIHLIRVLKKYPALFLFMAFDKNLGNLGLARHRIESIERDLVV
jgi:hypothetical protein